jgi:hypothetical protein
MVGRKLQTNLSKFQVVILASIHSYSSVIIYSQSRVQRLRERGDERESVNLKQEYEGLRSFMAVINVGALRSLSLLTFELNWDVTVAGYLAMIISGATRRLKMKRKRNKKRRMKSEGGMSLHVGWYHGLPCATVFILVLLWLNLLTDVNIIGNSCLRYFFCISLLLALFRILRMDQRALFSLLGDRRKRTVCTFMEIGSDRYLDMKDLTFPPTCWGFLCWIVGKWDHREWDRRQWKLDLLVLLVEVMDLGKNRDTKFEVYSLNEI